MAHFVDCETYAALVAALVNPSPAPGCDRRDAVIEALGEIGDVWPASIKADAMLAARHDHSALLSAFGEIRPE